MALRARDGKPIKVDGLESRLAGAVWLDGSRITWIRNGGSVRLLGLSWTQLFIQQDDILTGKTLWQKKLDTRIQLGALGESDLALLGGDGTLNRLDLDTGESVAVGRVPPADLKGAQGVYVFTDSENLYVAVNKPIQGSYYSVNLHSIRVNGPLLAFARGAAEGPPRWRTQISGMNLVLDKIEHSPLMLMVSRQYKREGNLRYYLMRLKAIDKETGQSLASLETPSNYWSFNGLKLNLAERYIELGSYNQRLRLTVGGGQRAAADPAR